MAAAGRRRTLLLVLVAALVIGFALGWAARFWTQRTPASRAHEALEEIRERARELTR